MSLIIGLVFIFTLIPYENVLAETVTEVNGAQSSVLLDENISISNNTNVEDRIEIIGINEGEEIKVYDDAINGNLLASVLAEKIESTTTAAISISQLGKDTGKVYISVTSIDKTTESERIEKSYDAERYTVSFEVDGGSSLDSQTVAYNEKALQPAETSKEGYTFDGWYVDNNYETEFDFENTPITEETTIYAKWVIEDPQLTATGIEPTGNWKDYADDSFEGGSGTEDDPYEIATAEQLALLAKLVNDDKLPADKDNYQRAHYKLLNDINLAAHQWTRIGIVFYVRENDQWIKIDRNFKGTFDGNGKKIDNLLIGTELNPDQNVDTGLFGRIDEATIKNLGVNVNIVSMCTQGGGVGGLVATSRASKIINCYTTGTLTVKYQQLTGGLVGISFGNRIIDSYSKVDVICEENTPVGGLVGAGYSGETIINSYATGNVTSKKGGPAGGIVGEIYYSRIINSYAVGNVTANLESDSNYKEDTPVGGFVGKLIDSTISNSYATGNVEAGRKSPVGGFAGQCEKATINNSYATGNLTGSEDVPIGGFVGINDDYSEINNGYYKDISAEKGVGQGTDNTIKLTQEEMKALTGESALFNILNENINRNIQLYIDWKPWTSIESKNSGYPIHTEKVEGPALTGVTMDDAANTMTGMTRDMEFSTDGTNWTRYDMEWDNLPDLTGNVELEVRMVETATYTAGPATTFNFTAEPTWQDYAADSFAGGSGTEENPYEIATAEQLAYLAKVVNEDMQSSDGSKYCTAYYKLTSDVDLAAHKWRPIGEIPKSFKGTFDGNGKKIINVHIGTEIAPDTTNALVGLFGLIENAAIKNIGVNISIVSGGEQGSYIGGIAGGSQNSTIVNSYVVGNITGGKHSYIGGIAGGFIGNIIENVERNAVDEDDLSTEEIEEESYYISNSYASVKTIGGERAVVAGVVGVLLGDDESIINNNYYNSSEIQKVNGLELLNEDKKGIGIIQGNLQRDITIPLTETQMKALLGTEGALVDRLNENRVGHFDWKPWTIEEGKNDGYPILTDVEPVPPLNSIEITTLPTKLLYKVGESLDITGMVVTGTYSDGTTKVETITEENVTGFDSSEVTVSQTLTVTVNGKTATYTISVEKADGPALTGVTMDDAVNTMTGMTRDMEFSTDGINWTRYSTEISLLPDLTGNIALQVRVAETATHTAGPATTFNFTVTKDTEDEDGNNSDRPSHNDNSKNDSSEKEKTADKLNKAAEKMNVTIDDGLRKTDNVEITLNLKDANLEAANAKYIMISNTGDFKDAKWVKYLPEMKWILDEGEGIKNIYMKFKDEDGNISNIINLKVILETDEKSANKEEDTTTGNILTFTKESGYKYSEGQWTNESVEFDFHDIGEVAVGDYLYSLDGGKTWENRKQGKIIDEGIIIVKYKTVNKDGNTVVNEAIVKVDKTPPEGDFTWDF
jgi:uncharacterized repeat protein (TIGR02543 family)